MLSDQMNFWSDWMDFCQTGLMVYREDWLYHTIIEHTQQPHHQKSQVEYMWICWDKCTCTLTSSNFCHQRCIISVISIILCYYIPTVLSPLPLADSGSCDQRYILYQCSEKLYCTPRLVRVQYKISLHSQACQSAI